MSFSGEDSLWLRCMFGDPFHFVPLRGTLVFFVVLLVAATLFANPTTPWNQQVGEFLERATTVRDLDPVHSTPGLKSL